jgi:hypothetical protein
VGAFEGGDDQPITFAMDVLESAILDALTMYRVYLAALAKVDKNSYITYRRFARMSSQATTLAQVLRTTVRRLQGEEQSPLRWPYERNS